MADTTNPGLVNVVNQGDGLNTVDQPVTVTRPCTNSGPIVQGANMKPGNGSVITSPSDVSPSTNVGPIVQGGTASPISPDTINTTENTVIDQPSSVQQYTKTINVFNV